ncbi:MAG: hypothetical protein GTO54_04740 [Nitrososphaeria archaeon]|nr:hypothetical protein [Nitrososphaeria archaeon]
MGEVIEEFASELPEQQWILVGHGNYLGGLRVPNPYEIGVYMPLTTSDLERYQPREIFLGHIHDAPEHPRVHYMGSPCGLDITETGKRHFLLYDTEDNTIQSHNVNVDVLFYDETLVMLPAEDEKKFLKQISNEMIESWELSEEELAKVVLRLNIEGYCADKAALDKGVKAIFSRFKFWKDEPPDTSEVAVSEDLERRYIVDNVKERLDELKWPEGPDEPDSDDILLAALSLIYGD